MMRKPSKTGGDIVSFLNASVFRTFVDIRVAAPPQQPTLSDAVESQPSLDEKVEQQALLGALQLNRGPAIHTNLTHRMDRLPFAPFHLYIVLALGISWILDGMEITLVSIVGTQLRKPETLGFSSVQVGVSASVYLLGAITGSLVFGFLTDRFGRKKLYLVTPLIYSVFTACTAFSTDFWTFCVFRFITGAGIGGEYSSINSTVDELLPPKVRGWADLMALFFSVHIFFCTMVNGSYWLGAALGAASSLIFLNDHWFGVNFGWRFAFMLGAILGLIILLMRVPLPESPRWLLIHNRAQEAEAIVSYIERKVKIGKGLQELPPVDPHLPPVVIYQQRGGTPIRALIRGLLCLFPSRAILGVVLMSSQAFFYNSIFFTYGMVLTDFHGVADDRVGVYMIPFALLNFLGPLALGRLFDTVGRRRMITFTYIFSALLLVGTGVLFLEDLLNAMTQTVCWSVVFFFSSPAASAAYLTVSEIFPLEVRAMAIAVFYSIGTALGGLLGPVIFGILVESEKPKNILIGYCIASATMIFAGIMGWLLGVDAEGKSLESIAAPLSSKREDGS